MRLTVENESTAFAALLFGDASKVLAALWQPEAPEISVKSED